MKILQEKAQAALGMLNETLQKSATPAISQIKVPQTPKSAKVKSESAVPILSKTLPSLSPVSKASSELQDIIERQWANGDKAFLDFQPLFSDRPLDERF